MDELYSDSVGAQFGEQALNQTVFAAIIGIILIAIFMIAVYRFTGLIASINIAIYVYVILLIFELMNGVLTLPGLAALILVVGMAVDANVLSFERIKEEIRVGYDVKSAVNAVGNYSIVFILDATISIYLTAI